MDTDSVNIEMTIRIDLVSRFFPLLATGFKVNARTACSIWDLLCRQIGIDEAYLEERIQTVFLNGKAVDDLAAPTVLDGSILSLSAAMPGLAGATLRRGGHLAAMRTQISHSQAETTMTNGRGQVTLKLFNLTTRDIGPFFLAKGIWISGSNFENVLGSYGYDLEKGCRLAKLDNRKIAFQHLSGMDWKSKKVYLKVTVSRD